MEKEKIEHITNTTAVIANPLIEAKYKLPVIEQKILHMLIAQIDFTDEELKFYSFYVSDFLTIFDEKNYTRQVKKSLDTLLNTKIKITKEKSFLETHWLSSAEYFEGGKIELEFSEKLKPFLIQLKKEFTKYNVAEINKFKSKFSIRIYLLMKQYQPLKERIINIEELKEMLQVSNFYPEYRNFKQKVLKIACEEINKLSDLKIEYEEIKKGRKVDKIKFYIIANKKENEGKQFSKSKKLKDKQENQEQKSDIDMDDLIDQLRKIIKGSLRTKEYKAILQAAGNNIELIKQKYQIAQKQRKIDNLVGWLITAIQEEYAEPVEKKLEKDSGKIKNSRFNNIECREYDYEDLERQLLNKGDC